MSDTVNDDVLTSLRHAERHSLGSVQRVDVRRAFSEPIEAAGRSIGDAALQTLVDGAAGYPFLLQLVVPRPGACIPTSRRSPRRTRPSA